MILKDGGTLADSALRDAFIDDKWEHAPSTVDVLIVTHRADICWFQYCIASVNRRLTGHQRVIVVCPLQDAELFEKLKVDHEFELEPTEDWQGLGYLWQQWVKMTHPVKAEAIIYFDSDVVLTAPLHVSQCFNVAGKPYWMSAPYSELVGDGATCWKLPTERAMGLPVDREYMQGFPFVMLDSTRKKAADHLRSVMGASPGLYLRHMAQAALPNGCPFSEFNFMGAVAWEFQHDDYAWIDRNNEAWPEMYRRCRQWWSHAPFWDKVEELSEAVYAEAGRSTLHRPLLTPNGFWVIAGDTHISKWCLESGRLDHDAGTVAKICELIPDGGVVVDAGAFIGDHSVAYGTKVGENGAVFAFEANPATFECLKRNCDRPVETVFGALGDAPLVGGMIVDSNAGASYLAATGPGAAEIPIVRIDALRLTRLDLLKIDIEGSEVRALKGARETIARFKPIIVIEVNRGALKAQGTSEAELLALLIELGYDRRELLSENNFNPEQYDLVCWHKENI